MSELNVFRESHLTIAEVDEKLSGLFLLISMILRAAKVLWRIAERTRGSIMLARNTFVVTITWFCVLGLTQFVWLRVWMISLRQFCHVLKILLLLSRTVDIVTWVHVGMYCIWWSVHRYDVILCDGNMPIMKLSKKAVPSSMLSTSYGEIPNWAWVHRYPRCRCSMMKTSPQYGCMVQFETFELNISRQ